MGNHMYVASGFPLVLCASSRPTVSHQVEHPWEGAGEQTSATEERVRAASHASEVKETPAQQSKPSGKAFSYPYPWPPVVPKEETYLDRVLQRCVISILIKRSLAVVELTILVCRPPLRAEPRGSLILRTAPASWSLMIPCAGTSLCSISTLQACSYQHV